MMDMNTRKWLLVCLDIILLMINAHIDAAEKCTRKSKRVKKLVPWKEELVKEKRSVLKKAYLKNKRIPNYDNSYHLKQLACEKAHFCVFGEISPQFCPSEPACRLNTSEGGTLNCIWHRSSGISGGRNSPRLKTLLFSIRQKEPGTLHVNEITGRNS